MAREKAPPPDTSGDVPLWFLTYSDVITLMMTFFILLLTFATSEPESFEQMKVTLFGGQGSTGIAGKEAEAMESDALVLRYRPRSSRLTTRGSEDPPQGDPHNESLSKGLEGLNEDRKYDVAKVYTVTMDLALLLDADDQLTNIGQQRLNMVARQLRKGTDQAILEVNNSEDAKRVTKMALMLLRDFRVPLGQTSVSIDTHTKRGKVGLRIQKRNQHE